MPQKIAQDHTLQNTVVMKTPKDEGPKQANQSDASIDSVIERRSAARSAIGLALAALGHEWEDRATHSGPERDVVVDGVAIYLVIAEDIKNSDWLRRSGNGRLRLKFGDYGEVRQFPEPKRGFDTRHIAAEISAYVRDKVARHQFATDLETRRRRSRAVVDAINAQLELDRGGEVRADVDIRTGRLMVSVQTICSEEMTRAILMAAVQLLRTEPR